VHRLTREEFIKKAKQAHGNRYDYSKVDYTGAHKKVIIICFIHGEFKQCSNDHLRGCGCKSCAIENKANNQRKDKKVFIKQAKLIHGNKYNYSKIKYKNNYTKVTIICSKHGEFEQTPSNHLIMNGCHQCGIEKITKTSKQFIENAKKMHGDKYNYSKIKYKNNHIKIIIICPDHGEFEQTPSSHLSGSGCRDCGIEKVTNLRKSNTKEFIQKAKNIHDNKYDYSKVNYVNNYKKIIIICQIHGEFKQTPNRHLCGCGCKKCAIEKAADFQKSNTKEFVQKAKNIHDNKYDYSKVNYKNSREKIIIICKKHGEFLQTPSGHLTGRGCLKCCLSNRSKIASEWLDYLNINENMREVKININNSKYYIVDGYNSINNTVYEFFGDFWHGNPKIFNQLDVNKKNNKKFGELYQNTLNKVSDLILNGYNVIYRWETDFDMGVGKKYEEK
jgi:hypothetical protein